MAYAMCRVYESKWSDTAAVTAYISNQNSEPARSELTHCSPVLHTASLTPAGVQLGPRPGFDSDLGRGSTQVRSPVVSVTRTDGKAIPSVHNPGCGLGSMISAYTTTSPLADPVLTSGLVPKPAAPGPGAHQAGCALLACQSPSGPSLRRLCAANPWPISMAQLASGGPCANACFALPRLAPQRRHSASCHIRRSRHPPGSASAQADRRLGGPWSTTFNPTGQVTQASAAAAHLTAPPSRSLSQRQAQRMQPTPQRLTQATAPWTVRLCPGSRAGRPGPPQNWTR
jgi:hypothetical protein